MKTVLKHFYVCEGDEVPRELREELRYNPPLHTEQSAVPLALHVWITVVVDDAPDHTDG